MYRAQIDKMPFCFLVFKESSALLQVYAAMGTSDMQRNGPPNLCANWKSWRDFATKVCLDMAYPWREMGEGLVARKAPWVSTSTIIGCLVKFLGWDHIVHAVPFVLF